MSAATIERKYQMTRLGAGDYLLPSNDGETLWRVTSYYEDGSATYQKEYTPGKGPSGRRYKLRGTFWNVWRWDGAFPTNDQLAAAFEADDDWTRWDLWDSGFRSRAEAVEYALGRSS